MSAAQRVAIIGGGAAGAVAATHLLREPRERGALEIELIDRTGTFGAGVAYGTEDPLHVLNVPAVRMGAIHGHPEHFHEWLAERGEPVAEEAFLPRGRYATYLRDLLTTAEREATDARLRRHGGEVVAIAEQVGDAAPLELTFADGERLAADRVVLALGPLSGGDPIRVPAGAEGLRPLRRRSLGAGSARRGASRPPGADRRHRPLDGRHRPLAGRRGGRAADPLGLPPRPGAAPPPPRPDQPAPLPHPDRERPPRADGRRRLRPDLPRRAAGRRLARRDRLDAAGHAGALEEPAAGGQTPLPERVPAALGRAPVPHGAGGGGPLRRLVYERSADHRSRTRSSRSSRTASGSASTCAPPARAISTRSRSTG